MKSSKKKIIYRIHIKNWEKYNAGSKPGHPNIMLSKRFFDDTKVQTLSPGGKLLWLGLLLRRGDVGTTFIEATRDDLLRLAGGSGHVVERLLLQLQSLQLLSFEIYDPLILIEVNRIEGTLMRNTADSAPAGSENPPAQVSLLPTAPKKEKKAVQRKQLRIVFENQQQLAEAIPEKTKELWRSMFNDDKEFIERELNTAFHYYTVEHPRKRPVTLGGWQSTLRSWLVRSWEWRRKRAGTR